MDWLEVVMPNPAFGVGSAIALVVGSLLLLATWSELWGLPVEVLDAVVVEGEGSTLCRPCLLREKKEEEGVGILEGLEAEDAMGGLDDGPIDIFSFDSALADCFADLKPNVPREAIAAARLAKHLKYLRR